MIVCYDHQIFESQIFGGISRYYFELISGINSGKVRDIDFILPITKSSNYYLKKVDSVAKQITGGSEYYRNFAGGLSFPGKWRMYQLWSKYVAAPQKASINNTLKHLRSAQFDLFHPTDLDDYFLNELKGKPFVITVHDMIDEYFPEYSFHVYHRYQTSIKEKLLNQASGIIAVSESTKRDILNRFSVDERKIKVIYHGGSQLMSGESDKQIALPFPYLLYVGKRTHYKNFYFLLQCLQPIFKKEKSLKIVCVGSPFEKKEMEYFADLNLKESVVYRSATDSELYFLYKNAVAFVYPSLYEGFGMPVLEAFSAGCPVILSNVSSLPEVAGDAAVYFNPKDMESMRHAIEQVLYQTSQRQSMIEKGFEQVKKFTWQRTLRETTDFYRSLL